MIDTVSFRCPGVFMGQIIYVREKIPGIECCKSQRKLCE